MFENECRKLGVCYRCGREPFLGRRLDRTGWRAMWWCAVCERPGFAGASFVRVEPERLMALPVIDEGDTQGSLL